MSEREALWRLGEGYKVTQALHVAVTLGIADLLADGARSSDELAAASDCHEPSLYRLLRALASLGVLREDDSRRFALTPLGEPLRSDGDSLAGWIAYAGRDFHWHAWGHLMHSVRTGETAVQDTFGQSVWEYRAEHPEESRIFDRAMTDLTRVRIPHVISSYDFTRFGTVVDVGGGHGALLAAILAAAPAAKGILFDQQHVVAGAPPLLEAAGVSNRCEVVAGDFFDRVPDGGDAYVLKSIIHDWDDDHATRILKTCRAAMTSSARLLVLERDLGGANDNPGAKLSDLNMLVAAGGRERSQDEYAALFEESGLSFVGETATPAAFSVFEAAPA